ncbi:MAG: cytochrome c [Inquilinus sp.]|nr:cytochrome c [Inquilinus sp.]
MNRKHRNGLLLTAAVVALGGGYYLWPNVRPAAGLADPNDAALVALGRQVYAAECAACHGARLEGEPDWRQPLESGGRPAPPHDETGHTWHHPDSQLFALTKYGGQPFSPAGYQSNMPAFEDRLTDREIEAALAFIKSTWPDQIRARQRRISARAP